MTQHFIFFSTPYYFFRARGVYYLSTNPTPPFAQGHPNRNKNRRRSIVSRLFQQRRRWCKLFCRNVNKLFYLMHCIFVCQWNDAWFRKSYLVISRKIFIHFHQSYYGQKIYRNIDLLSDFTSNIFPQMIFLNGIVLNYRKNSSAITNHHIKYYSFYI